MRQTKKGRKTTRNFRTTRRKRGGMPPRLDERTLKYLQGLQVRIEKEKEKKQNSESQYKALQYSEESYKKYLADQAKKEAEKEEAEKKALADAKAKAAADAKARTEAAAKAAAAKVLADAKAKEAADAKAKTEADNAAKIAAAAEILEQKRLQKAADEAAKEERKRLRAEAEKVAAAEAALAAAAAAAEKKRIQSEKKAQKKLEKAQTLAATSTNSERSTSSYASAKSHTTPIGLDVDTSGLSVADIDISLAKSLSPTMSRPITPIDKNGEYNPLFWDQFFTPEEIKDLSRDVSCTSIDNTKFFIPEIQAKNVKIGSVVVDSKKAASINRVLCKLIRIFGIMEAKFNELKFEYELLWKGTRAITLATGVSIDTHDIDMEIINRDRKDESDPEDRIHGIENRRYLARHIGTFIVNLISGARLSILDPQTPGVMNPDIIKISYMVGDNAYIPILDLSFDKKYTIKINDLPHSIADRDEKYIETITTTGLYKHPSIVSMKREKEVYLQKFTIENKKNDMEKMKAGLFKIDFALGKITKTPVDMRSKKLTEEDIEKKNKLQALIDARLAESKAQARSQKPSSNSNASKP
jgi:hypothetical protein